MSVQPMTRRGLVVGDVQLVAHHLPEGGAGALAAIGLADVERCGVVGMNHDPGVELQEVGIGIGAGGGCAAFRGKRVGAGQSGDAQADDQCAGSLEETAARGRIETRGRASSTAFGSCRALLTCLLLPPSFRAPHA